MQKGQVMSIDLAVSALVFVLLLGFLYTTWQSNMVNWEEQRQSMELEAKTVQQARNLVETPGYPSDWVPGTVEIIGLAKQPNVLNTEKISFFASMDYNVAREKMNIFNYDFRVEIRSDNSALDQNIGNTPGLDSRVVTIERQVLIGGDHATFRFKLFR